MGWTRLKVNRNSEGHPWMSLGFNKRGRHGQLKFTLSATVATYLEVQPGDQIHLLRGTGEHQGWVRMCKRLNGDDSGHAVRIVSGFRALHHHGATIGASRGSTDSANPELLWTDLLRFVALHDGAARFRSCRRFMLLGAGVRINARRVLAAGLSGAERVEFRARTEAYRNASEAVRNTAWGNVIASA